jgi:hypothetical protein
MHWWQFVLLGAGGGALVEILVIFRWFATWQSARRTPTGRVKSQPPELRKYVDVPVHLWMAVARMTLGAGAAALFGMTDQINGVYGAVALGFAAPSMLAQLGSIPKVAAAVAGAEKPVSLGDVQRKAIRPVRPDEAASRGEEREAVGEA